MNSSSNWSRTTWCSPGRSADNDPWQGSRGVLLVRPEEPRGGAVNLEDAPTPPESSSCPRTGNSTCWPGAGRLGRSCPPRLSFDRDRRAVDEVWATPAGFFVPTLARDHRHGCLAFARCRGCRGGFARSRPAELPTPRLPRLSFDWGPVPWTKRGQLRRVFVPIPGKDLTASRAVRWLPRLASLGRVGRSCPPYRPPRLLLVGDGAVDEAWTTPAGAVPVADAGGNTLAGRQPAAPLVYFAPRDRRRLLNPGTSEGSFSPTRCQPVPRSHVRGAATSRARSTSA